MAYLLGWFDIVTRDVKFFAHGDEGCIPHVFESGVSAKT